ncbi:helix-turn-helix transcriptional regulator [Myceligenerans indicum]|uniref:helix-turn-helix transcriptional regulator n=1 Tax=Myceligenerans indicum TaxID=2593663 RepID=UPI00191F9D7B|nr:helix-turn-helix transcriptional regulator [Myceligenerans indicum]
MIGPSGSGKTATVMHALRGLGPDVPVLRVQRIWSRRPHARFLGPTERSDLVVLPSDADGNVATGFFESVTENLGGKIPRVVFVDDAGVLTEKRLAWLQRLADEAFALDCRVVVAAEELAPDVLPDELDVLRLGPLGAPALRAFLTDALGLSIAADVVERITWWSEGNPRLALELAQELSVAQLRGGALWHGPDAAGTAARRTYRHLLERVDESGADLLASFVLRQAGSCLGEEPWDGAAGLGDDPSLRVLAGLGLTEAHDGTWFLRHPLVAVLCAERNKAEPPAAPTAERRSEAMLRGLHMQELNPVLRAGPLSVACPKNRALAFTVSVLAGQTWGVPRAGASGDVDCREWADHVWWRAATGIPEPARESSRRLTAAALRVESEGVVRDPARLRADLEAVGETPGQHWLGLQLQIRMRLMLGDVSGARALVAAHVDDDARGVAEQVARSLSVAMVAAVEGQFHDVRRQLDIIRRLRPGCDGWLVPRGLTALADAAIDGRVPDVGVPDALGNWSARAAAEFAADVGAAHLLLGRAREAVSLLAVSAEQCRWPYQCPVMVRADLVDAAVSAGEVQALSAAIGGSAVNDCGALSADLRAAAARGAALLADGERALAAFDEAVRASTPPASIRQHVRTLVAYGRFRAARGDAGVAVAAFDRGRTLAQLAGLAGWTRGIDTAQTASGGAVASNRWEGLRRDERTMVRLALKGATNSKIAESVFVSERTVVNRLRQVYRRLGIRDRRDLIRLAEECPPRWAAAEV